MTQILLLIVSIFLFSFLEPLMYFAFGISTLLILAYTLFNKRIKTFPILLITVVALILDTTLKFPIGSHLLSIVSVLGVWYIFERFIPADIPFFEFIKLFVSFVIGLFILKYLKSYSFSMMYLTNTLVPAFFSALFATIFSGIFSQFGSNNALNKLRIK